MIQKPAFQTKKKITKKSSMLNTYENMLYINEVRRLNLLFFFGAFLAYYLNLTHLNMQESDIRYIAVL